MIYNSNTYSQIICKKAKGVKDCHMCIFIDFLKNMIKIPGQQNVQRVLENLHVFSGFINTIYPFGHSQVANFRGNTFRTRTAFPPYVCFLKFAIRPIRVLQTVCPVLPDCQLQFFLRAPKQRWLPQLNNLFR